MVMLDMSHKREMPVVYVADIPGLFKIKHTFDREYDVYVFISARMFIIVMRDDYIRGECICWNLPERRVAGRIRHVERGLQPKMYATCGDQC